MNLRSLPTSLLLASIVQAAAINAIECGDHINYEAELTEDLACDCSNEPALIVEGPYGILDLKDFSVSCIDPGTGDLSDHGQVIDIIGHEALVFDGSVHGGGIGIDLEGDGSHTLFFLHVADAAHFGIVTQAGSNGNPKVARSLTLATMVFISKASTTLF